jgi:16S rRNA (uracil1498-N3)-methyltransferase
MRRRHAHRFLFYAPELDSGTHHVELTGEEHRHLSRVLRMKTGETVFVTNGRGMRTEGRVDTVSARVTRVVLHGEPAAPAERPVAVALACLRRDAFAQAVKQCTELGMTQCIPFTAARVQVPGYSAAFRERLQHIALAAMKQSFRATLPQIDEAVPLQAVLDRASTFDVRMAGDAAAPPLQVDPEAQSVIVLVGPEAGLAEEEWAEITRAGFRRVSASPHRLRSETAAALLVGLANSAR